MTGAATETEAKAPGAAQGSRDYPVALAVGALTEPSLQGAA